MKMFDEVLPTLAGNPLTQPFFLCALIPSFLSILCREFCTPLSGCSDFMAGECLTGGLPGILTEMSNFERSQGILAKPTHGGTRLL